MCGPVQVGFVNMNRFSAYLLVLLLAWAVSGCQHDDSSSFFIKVYKHDGSIQCGSRGVPLEDMMLELTNIGVDVVCSQKGHDGKFRATVCGIDTGYINIYKINFVNLQDAEFFGFESVANLGEYRDEKCD